LAPPLVSHSHQPEYVSGTVSLHLTSALSSMGPYGVLCSFVLTNLTQLISSPGFALGMLQPIAVVNRRV
jgi:hypothetical protein